MKNQVMEDWAFMRSPHMYTLFLHGVHLMDQRGEDLDPFLIANVFASQKGFLLKIKM